MRSLLIASQEAGVRHAFLPHCQWGRNAWRTPENVCVGGYTKLWVAMNVQDLIQFRQSSGGRDRGREGYRREREKFKKASFRYLLLLTSSQRNELNNVSWLSFNFLRGLKQNFIRERSQNTKIRSQGKNTALLPVKLETFPSRLHHRTWMRWHGTCTHPGVVNR